MNFEFIDYIENRIKTAVESNKFLSVNKSWIPGASLGLFCKRDIANGQIISCYRGRILNTKEAIRLKDKSYLMRLGFETYVDAINSKYILARYINDCRNISGYNVYFLKSRSEKCAWVIASRDISSGEEIFVDYGRWYWAGGLPEKPNCLTFFKLNKLRNNSNV